MKGRERAKERGVLSETETLSNRVTTEVPVVDELRPSA